MPDQHGATVRLADRLALGPVVVVFYRGGWCPFCTLTLRAWQDALPGLHDAGGDLLAVFTDGLLEVRSPAGDQLDEHLLHRVLTSREHQSADAIADAVVNLALQHADSRLRDDALVIVARKQ